MIRGHIAGAVAREILNEYIYHDGVAYKAAWHALGSPAENHIIAANRDYHTMYILVWAKHEQEQTP